MSEVEGGGVSNLVLCPKCCLIESTDVSVLCNIYCFVIDIKSSHTKHTDLGYRRKVFLTHIYVK